MSERHVITDLLGAITAATADITKRAPELLRRAAISTAKGYPSRTSTVGHDGPSALPPGDPNDPASWPAPSYGDPVGEVTLRSQPDPVRQDLRSLLSALGRAQREMVAAVAHLDHGLGVKLVLPDPDPGCESCRRINDSTGKPTWSPTLTADKTTVGGRLKTALHLDRWCYDFVGINDRLPTREEVAAHLQGKPVRRKAVITQGGST